MSARDINYTVSQFGDNYDLVQKWNPIRNGWIAFIICSTIGSIITVSAVSKDEDKDGKKIKTSKLARFFIGTSITLGVSALALYLTRLNSLYRLNQILRRCRYEQQSGDPMLFRSCLVNRLENLEQLEELQGIRSAINNQNNNRN